MKEIETGGSHESNVPVVSAEEVAELVTGMDEAIRQESWADIKTFWEKVKKILNSNPLPGEGSSGPIEAHP